MQPRFKKYDEKAKKTVIVPIWELNEIFEKYGTDLRVIPKNVAVKDHYEAYKTRTEKSQVKNIEEYEEKYFHKEIECYTGDTRSHKDMAGQILGLNIESWEWTPSGYDIEIIYTIKE